MTRLIQGERLYTEAEVRAAIQRALAEARRICSKGQLPNPDSPYWRGCNMGLHIAERQIADLDAAQFMDTTP